MPTIQASDILFLLSGGTSNQTPDNSLGGAPSSTRVSGNLNSLFSDVTAAEAEAGLTDYRCFYVLNKSETETLYSASVHIQIQSSGGSFADLGVAKSTEVQRIQISGNPTSGVLTLRLDDKEFHGEWAGSAEAFLLSLSSSLSNAGLSGVSLSHSAGPPHAITMSFLGSLNNRSHPLVEVVNNTLSPASAVSVSRTVQGLPINSLAPLIATPSTPPASVAFVASSPSAKILVGDLGPGDSFPVWVKRNTLAGTDFKENDSLVIRLSGNPFGSPTTPGSSSSSSSSSSSGG